MPVLPRQPHHRRRRRAPGQRADDLPPLRRDCRHTPARAARAPRTGRGLSLPGPALDARQREKLAVTQGLTGPAPRQTYLAAKTGHTPRPVIDKDRENARRAA
jgi:hypothetical protein